MKERKDARHLVVFLGLGSLGYKVESAGSSLVLVVGDGDLGEMEEDVLHLGVGA